MPVPDKFQKRLEGQWREVGLKTLLTRALEYALNNWTALVRYTTEAGFLAIVNNVPEREMKRIAIRRKSWLFAGSPCGGPTAAVLARPASHARANAWATSRKPICKTC